MSDPFYDPPKGTSRRKAVLAWNDGTYRPLDEVAGEQPYYTYQGIGNITGRAFLNVVHLGDQVTHNGQKVIYYAK